MQTWCDWCSFDQRSTGFTSLQTGSPVGSTPQVESSLFHLTDSWLALSCSSFSSSFWHSPFFWRRDTEAAAAMQISTDTAMCMILPAVMWSFGFNTGSHLSSHMFPLILSPFVSTFLLSPFKRSPALLFEFSMAKFIWPSSRVLLTLLSHLKLLLWLQGSKSKIYWIFPHRPDVFSHFSAREPFDSCLWHYSQH